jgi:hypothetical protein
MYREIMIGLPNSGSSGPVTPKEPLVFFPPTPEYNFYKYTSVGMCG